MTETPDTERELQAARAVIADQALRLSQLERRVSDDRADLLREIVELSRAVAGTVGEAPYRALLQGIVVAAARLFDAAASSVAILDHDTNELVFEAASGDQGIVGMRFPAHQGIAGWVVMTGEALAVSDVRRDPRFAKDFAQSTGYVPRSIMAVPLIVRDDVEGVLEVLDKASAASFGLDDMELLGLFARPAAVAVEQARLVSGIGELLVAEMGRLAAERGQEDLAQAAKTALSGDGSSMQEMLELARFVHQVSSRGDRARRLALDVLRSIARHLG